MSDANHKTIGEVARERDEARAERDSALRERDEVIADNTELTRIDAEKINALMRDLAAARELLGRALSKMESVPCQRVPQQNPAEPCVWCLFIKELRALASLPSVTPGEPKKETAAEMAARLGFKPGPGDFKPDRASDAGPGAEPTPTGMEPGQRCTRYGHRDIVHEFVAPRDADWRESAAEDAPFLPLSSRRCPYVEGGEPRPRGGPTCEACGGQGLQAFDGTPGFPVVANCAMCGGTGKAQS